MKITPQLIRKYLNNSCTPLEKAAVDEWYKSFDEHPDPLRFMDAAEQDSLRKNLYARFRESIAGKIKADKQNPLNHRLYTVLCAVTGMAAIMLLVFKLNINNRQAQLPVSGSNVQITVRNTSLSIYKKTLPDNSTVWLSPQSAITYPQKFSGNYRAVSLQGEAFFEVTKDKQHPFIIGSRELTTKVWGTSFRVRAFQNSPAEVSVVTGKVSVHKNNAQQEIMLLPNQKVTLVHHKQLVKDDSPVIEKEMRIWKKISLSFEDVRMNRVFTALNNKFGINIYSTDAKLNNLVFTADFTDQSLPAILDMIKESINARYTIEQGRSFVFAPNNPL